VWGYRAAGWRVPLSTQQPQVLVLPSLTGCVGCAQVAKGSMRAGGRVRALLRDARAQVSERERERERESESEIEREREREREREGERERERERERAREREGE
jgi:hypothetical protein